MLKQNEYALAILNKFMDVLVLMIAWAISFAIRYFTNDQASYTFLIEVLRVTPLIIILSLYFFKRHGLYESHRFKRKTDEVMNLLRANTFSIIFFVITVYFVTPNRVSRVMLAVYFLLSNLFIIAWRMSVRNYLRQLREQGKNLRHYLLVGHGHQMITYIESIKRFKHSGIRFQGWIDGVANNKYNIPCLEMSLDEAKNKYNPDLIIVGHSAENYKKVDDILMKTQIDLTAVQVLPDLGHALVGHKIEDFEGIPILNINTTSFDAGDYFFKRSFDFILSLIGLIFISPILLFVAIGVKLSSPGPVLFGQDRVGLDGKNFKMWKFRSMKVQTENQSTTGWTTANDPRKTKFGSFIRKTSLDELPQFFNVLLGDMSLVGPRPEVPYWVEKFKHEIPGYMLKHRMKAGITGWAQVNGWRGDTSIEKRIECDIYYIKNWSLWLDIKILFLTVFKGFVNKNAY